MESNNIKMAGGGSKDYKILYQQEFERRATLMKLAQKGKISFISNNKNRQTNSFLSSFATKTDKQTNNLVLNG